MLEEWIDTERCLIYRLHASIDISRFLVFTLHKKHSDETHSSQYLDCKKDVPETDEEEKILLSF